MVIVRHKGRPSPADTAEREARAAAVLGDAAVRGAGRADRRGGRVVSGPCPRCGAPMYDPADDELTAGCLYCGHVEYSAQRGYYHGAGARA